jgi:hypothetical protein
MSAPAADGANPALFAFADLGSATSRNEPGRRHVVRLCGRRLSVVVAGFLSKTAAEHLAEAINELLADSLGDGEARDDEPF